MLSTEGSVKTLKKTQWAFEGKWDGYRVLVDADHGKLTVRSRRGRDVTDEYPEFEVVAADLAEHHAILDGEAVALDESGVPSFGEMQNRARSTRVESGHSTSCTSMGVRSCARSTPTAGGCWRLWPTAAG